MNKKFFNYIILAAIILCMVGGGLYYYFYVDTVSNYFLVKYTPPQPRESIFGGREYSTPKFEFSQLRNFDNDNEAIEHETKEAKDTYKWLLKKYDEELALPKDENPIIQNARMNSITSMLEEQRILIRTTHIRKFSPEEALQMIQEHWADKSLNDYAKANKIDVAVYRISKL